MLRKFLICPILFLLMAQIGWALPEQLNIGIHNNLRPLEFTSKNGASTGILPELWKRWGADHAVSINLVSGTDDELQRLLQSEEIDILANAAPAAELHYSTPYFSHAYHLFSLKSFRLDKAKQLPLRIGVLHRDKPFLPQDELNQGQFTLYSDFTELSENLKRGEIDAFIANDIDTLYSIHNTDLLRLHYPDNPAIQRQIRAAVLPTNAALLAQIDESLEQVAQENRESLNRRWIPSTFGYRIPWTLIIVSLAVILGIALIITIWLINTSLRSQVFNATRSLIQEKKALSQAKDDAVARQNTINVLLDAVHSCIFALNERGEVTHMNKHAKNWLAPSGTAGQENISHSFPFLEAFKSRLLNALCERQPINFPHRRITLHDNSEILVNIRLKPIVIEGEAQALVLIDDITEATLNEELLLQSQKLDIINSLAGGVAHDFNNILGVISGSINMLKHKLAKTTDLSADNLNRYIENIFHAVDKGAATTKSMAALGGQVSVDFTDLAFNDAINDVISICRTTMDRSVTIDYIPPKEKFWISGNRGLLEQALLNVMINAYHAMTIMRAPGAAYGGTLSLALSAATPDLQHGESTCEYCRLQIKDQGIGFSQEQLAQAFTPFYTTKDKSIGTGLGLTMVQNTIAQHQGQVIIDSEQGAGTAVYISLPRVVTPDADLESSASELLAQTPDTDFNILLADDNPRLIEGLCAELESHGHRVTCVANGEQLVEAYRETPDRIDIVITDLEMPSMNGDTAFYEIKKIDPQAKVIITSGFIEDQRVQQVLQAGADGFIPKPCNLNILLNKIHSCLAQ